MARQESNREDLLAEATALVERVEIEIPQHPESIVAGFRRDGSLSIFFGGDVVYQFNSQRELRRAFSNNLLYKAEAGRLVSLHRVRTADETQFVRRDLDDSETDVFLRNCSEAIRVLADALRRGDFNILRQVPSDADVCARVRSMLELLNGSVVIARSPRAN